MYRSPFVFIPTLVRSSGIRRRRLRFFRSSCPCPCVFAGCVVVRSDSVVMRGFRSATFDRLAPRWLWWAFGFGRYAALCRTIPNLRRKSKIQNRSQRVFVCVCACACACVLACEGVDVLPWGHCYSFQTESKHSGGVFEGNGGLR